MHERADQLAGRFLTVDEQLQQEFDCRLVESSRLVFRVAFGVLRHHEDAEDVAQEAFTKAYRSFAKLRDRNRFRAWIVRMTWRLALNKRRTDQRRLSREAREEIASVRTAAESPCAPSSWRRGANRSRSGSLVAVSHGNSLRSSTRRNASRLSPSRPCQPSSATSSRSPPMDFTGYRKIASTCPMSMSMFDASPS